MKGDKVILEKFNLTTCIIANISQLKIKFVEKDISIVNEINEEYYVKADKEMVNLVLRNLFLNAIKFSNRGAEIKINVARKNSEIETCIKDHGIGMDADKLNSLFNDKIQSAAIGTENERGSGLGLLLCKDFIEKSNGKIWAESDGEGKGATFYSLPAGV